MTQIYILSYNISIQLARLCIAIWSPPFRTFWLYYYDSYYTFMLQLLQLYIYYRLCMPGCDILQNELHGSGSLLGYRTMWKRITSKYKVSVARYNIYIYSYHNCSSAMIYTSDIYSYMHACMHAWLLCMHIIATVKMCTCMQLAIYSLTRSI